MKKLSIFGLLVALLLSCSDDIDERKKGFFSMSFDIPQSLKSSGIDQVSSAIISLSSDGVSLIDFNDRKVEVSADQGKFSTEKIEISAGSYVVEKFQLINTEGDVIFAVPKKESELQNNVSLALPLDFSVQDTTSKSLDIEVLPTVEKTAANFGYNEFYFQNKEEKILRSAPYIHFEQEDRVYFPGSKFSINGLVGDELYKLGSARVEMSFEKFSPDYPENGIEWSIPEKELNENLKFTKNEKEGEISLKLSCPSNAMHGFYTFVFCMTNITGQSSKYSLKVSIRD